jgi:hypothetical protein
MPTVGTADGGSTVSSRLNTTNIIGPPFSKRPLSFGCQGGTASDDDDERTPSGLLSWLLCDSGFYTGVIPLQS